MWTLRHEAATAQQQLQFYQAQYPTTAVLDAFSLDAKDKEDTEQEDTSCMETLSYQPDYLDSEDEETAQPINRPTYDLTIPLPYGPITPPPDDNTLIANEALFQVAQDALKEFFATLPNNLRGGAATAEDHTTTLTESAFAAATTVSAVLLKISPTVAALSMLSPGNFPPSIPTEGQTQTDPDSSSHTPLHVEITFESEAEEEDSKLSDTEEDETEALDAVLLEEDEDDDQSENDANTTGTATRGHDDPYDIQGLEDVPVATTLATSQMDISPSPNPPLRISFCSPFMHFVVFISW